MYLGVALGRVRVVSWLRALVARTPAELASSSLLESVTGGEDLDLSGSGVCVLSVVSVARGASEALPGVKLTSFTSVLLGLLLRPPNLRRSPLGIILIPRATA